MQILIRAPKELKEYLLARAKAEGFTLNGLILTILWAYMRSGGKQAAGTGGND